ncbi:hypothetical protein B0H14DRAFT_3150461 [Mycena olivaceomarginata]|nr:hypothetical protein B0H14DRAFT_3150461 [Mycena olivaceomarginata]
MIPVPGRGWRPKSEVRLIPHGGRVVAAGDEFHLLDADDNIIHVAHNGRNVSLNKRDGVTSPGWITMAVRDGSTSQDITSSTATWTVPAAPLTHHTQLLYYFNALATGWSVNSWFLTPTMNYVTTTVPVQVGQVLTGVMTQTKHSATSYSVTSKFTGLANSSFSGTATEPVYDAYACALETYSITPYSLDYPAGTLTLFDVSLTFAGTAPTVTYGTYSWHTDIGTTDIITDGIKGAKMVIHHPTPFQLMTFCTGANFTGSCDTVAYPSAASVPLASAGIQCASNLTSPFLASISSVKILPTAGYACHLYTTQVARVLNTWSTTSKMSWLQISTIWRALGAAIKFRVGVHCSRSIEWTCYSGNPSDNNRDSEY